MSPTSITSNITSHLGAGLAFHPTATIARKVENLGGYRFGIKHAPDNDYVELTLHQCKNGPALARLDEEKPVVGKGRDLFTALRSLLSQINGATFKTEQGKRQMPKLFEPEKLEPCD